MLVFHSYNSLLIISILFIISITISIISVNFVIFGVAARCHDLVILVLDYLQNYGFIFIQNLLFSASPLAAATGQYGRHDRARVEVRCYAAVFIFSYNIGFMFSYKTLLFSTGQYGRHDRARVEVRCYAARGDDGSDVRAAIRRGCDAFVEVLVCCQSVIFCIIIIIIIIIIIFITVHPPFPVLSGDREGEGGRSHPLPLATSLSPPPPQLHSPLRVGPAGAPLRPHGPHRAWDGLAGRAGSGRVGAGPGI